MECQHSHSELRKKTFSNNTEHFGKQCLRCGALAGNWVKKDEALRLVSESQIARWDDELQDQYWAAVSLQNTINRERSDHNKPAFDYIDYLQSPEWRRKRDFVLRRDKYMCQGCFSRVGRYDWCLSPVLQTRAELVHHLTYEHIGEEFCFELTSLCRDCHERYHQKGSYGRQ